MASSCLERNRRLYKELLQKDIVHGKKLLSESNNIIDLDKFSIRLNQCIRLLKINSDNLELTHENISLAATKDNEKDILTQMKMTSIFLIQQLTLGWNWKIVKD